MYEKRGGVRIRFQGRVVEYDGDGILKNDQIFTSVSGHQGFHELMCRPKAILNQMKSRREKNTLKLTTIGLFAILKNSHMCATPLWGRRLAGAARSTAGYMAMVRPGSSQRQREQMDPHIGKGRACLGEEWPSRD